MSQDSSNIFSDYSAGMSASDVMEFEFEFATAARESACVPLDLGLENTGPETIRVKDMRPHTSLVVDTVDPDLVPAMTTPMSPIPGLSPTSLSTFTFGPGPAPIPTQMHHHPNNTNPFTGAPEPALPLSPSLPTPLYTRPWTPLETDSLMHLTSTNPGLDWPALHHVWAQRHPAFPRRELSDLIQQHATTTSTRSLSDRDRLEIWVMRNSTATESLPDITAFLAQRGRVVTEVEIEAAAEAWGQALRIGAEFAWLQAGCAVGGHGFEGVEGWYAETMRVALEREWEVVRVLVRERMWDEWEVADRYFDLGVEWDEEYIRGVVEAGPGLGLGPRLVFGAVRR